MFVLTLSIYIDLDHLIPRGTWGCGVIHKFRVYCMHNNDVIMSAIASQISGFSIVCPNVDSGTDQRNHQSSASLAFVRGFHRSPVNSQHKRPVSRKMFPFDDVIMGSSFGVYCMCYLLCCMHAHGILGVDCTDTWAWMNNHMPCKVWNEITPIPKFQRSSHTL